MALCWCYSIDSPDHPHNLVKTQRWCWPLLQSEGIIPTILSLFQRTKAQEDGTNEPSWKCQALVVGMKILKRLSVEENQVQEIRRLGGQDLFITLLAQWVCGTDDAFIFPHAARHDVPGQSRPPLREAHLAACWYHHSHASGPITDHRPPRSRRALVGARAP